VLALALGYLDTPPANDMAKLSNCRAALANDLNGDLNDVRRAIASGNRDEARKKLIDMNDRFGGLASDDIASLSQP
jgi:hypothetical protein